MNNSSLVSYTLISPNKNTPRDHAIDTISIHCMAGNLSLETCANIFQTKNGASANYGIDSNGKIGMFVEEKDRSWCSSNRANDMRAVTIEVANDGGAPEWHVSDQAMKSLINLVADICKRNGIKKLMWKADKSLIGQIDKQNMTVHRWFDAKACPGDYLYNKHGYIADEVNKILGGTAAVVPASTTPVRVLRRRCKGEDVKELQINLNRVINANLALDGSYGPATEQAVKEYQKRYGLEVDGIFGPASRAKMEEILKGVSEQPKNNIKVGSFVRIKKGAKTYDGKSLASFVYDRVNVVKEISGDRAVLTYNKVIVAAVKTSDLVLA